MNMSNFMIKLNGIGKYIVLIAALSYTTFASECYNFIEHETELAATDLEDFESPAKIVALKDGGFASVWEDNAALGDGGTNRTLKIRYFESNGTARTGDIKVSNLAVDGTDGYDVDQFDVIQTTDGNVVVSWLSENAMLSDTPVAAIFDATGKK
ncbi:MAG: hypothetical protein DSZ08_05060, partial [Sulfurovum sp.]